MYTTALGAGSMSAKAAAGRWTGDLLLPETRYTGCAAATALHSWKYTWMLIDSEVDGKKTARDRPGLVLLVDC